MGWRYERERCADRIARAQGLVQRRVRLRIVTRPSCPVVNEQALADRWLQRFDKFERFLVAAPLKIMSQARIDSLWGHRLQFVDLLRAVTPAHHVGLTS